MAGHEEGTGAGLFGFLEWAGRKGEMNAQTADAWATASRRVLSLEDGADAVDLRSLDVEALLSRFETLNRTKYSAASMNTYKSRFRQAVAAYLAWLGNEPWKPAQRASRKKAVKVRRGEPGPTASPAELPERGQEVVPLPAHTSAASRLIQCAATVRFDG